MKIIDFLTQHSTVIIDTITAIAIGVFCAYLPIRASIKKGKAIDTYEKVIALLTELKLNPMLAFDEQYYGRCVALSYIVTTFGKKTVVALFDDFCQEVEKIYTEYAIQFQSEEVLAEKDALKQSVPFAEELFEREEEDHMLYTMLESHLLPSHIEESIEKIILAIQRQLKIKKTR